ncbi:MAG: hypothetical protein ACRDY7_16500 [Acidimicrobiia bacterium]
MHKPHDPWRAQWLARTLGAVAIFGASYAVVSLGCTLPNFLGPVAATLSRDLASGVAVFVAYSAGIALVLMSLTLAMGLAKGSLVRHFRRVLPYVGRASGVLLVLTGAGLAVTLVEHHDEALARMVEQIDARLRSLRMLTPAVVDFDLDAALGYVARAGQAVADGAAGYVLLAAERRG